MRMLRQLFLEDIGLKLWSFILALILWYAIQGERVIEAFIEVPVEIKNRPQRLIVANDVADKIRLTVRGTQSRINQLRAETPEPYLIDLRNSAPGNILFKVFTFDFKMPEGVAITRIHPTQLMVLLERQQSRRLPVLPQFSGALENGFSVEATSVEPPSVTVNGPESELAQLQGVPTQPIALDGVRRDIAGTYEVEIADDAVSSVDGDPHVTVRVKIAEHPLSEQLEQVPIELRGAPSRADIYPRVATLMIRGPAGTINDFKKQPPRLYVDARYPTEEGQGVPHAKIRAEVPATCEVIKIMPETVKLLPGR